MSQDKKKRELSDQQKSFLSHLLGDARGNFKKALELAGYSKETKASDIIKSLREEIIEAARDNMALNAPLASFEVVDTMSNPNTPMATLKLKAAIEVLDRAGVSQPKEDVNLKIPTGGLFILPAKDVKQSRFSSTGDEVDEKEAKLATPEAFQPDPDS